MNANWNTHKHYVYFIDQLVQLPPLYLEVSRVQLFLMVIICICNAIRRNKAENDEETTPNQPTVSCITTTNLHSMFYRITYKTEVNITKGPLWLRSYGSWIYNYLCNQYISPLTLWVRIPPRRGVLDTTLCDKVCQWFVAGQWFSLGIPV